MDGYVNMTHATNDTMPSPKVTAIQVLRRFSGFIFAVVAVMASNVSGARR